MSLTPIQKLKEGTIPLAGYRCAIGHAHRLPLSKLRYWPDSRVLAEDEVRFDCTLQTQDGTKHEIKIESLI